MNSLHFTHPEALVFLISIPLLLVTHHYMLKFTNRKAMRFANLNTLYRISGKKQLTKNISVLILRLLTLIFVILAISQPYILKEDYKLSSDYVFAIDNSASMVAQDISPNRLKASISKVNDFINLINKSGRFSVITFAGTPKIILPPTSDKIKVQQVLDNVDFALSSGTDIGGALITATNLLTGSPQAKTVLLFTDGSSTTGTDIDNSLSSSISYAKEHGVRVYTIGVGSIGQAPIGYIPRLNNITAVFNEQDLEFIANTTGGEYVHISDEVKLTELFANLVEDKHPSITKQELSGGLIILALMMLFFEWGLTNTRFRIIP